MSIAFPAGLTRTYENGALAPWQSLASATVANATTDAQWGTSCAVVNTPGAVTFEGIRSASSSTDATHDIPVSASTQYTLSVYVKAPAASTFQLRHNERDAGNVSVQTISTSNDGTGAWTRFTSTFTTAATTTVLRDLRVQTRSTAQAIEFRVDGWQLDLGAVALDYDGADSTPPATPQILRPDADLATTGWSTAPLWSKVSDQSDATVISATCA